MLLSICLIICHASKNYLIIHVNIFWLDFTLHINDLNIKFRRDVALWQSQDNFFFRETEWWRKRARNDLTEFASLTWQSAISTGPGVDCRGDPRYSFYYSAERAPSAAGGFFYFAISLSFRWTDPRFELGTRPLCQFGGIIGSRRSSQKE